MPHTNGERVQNSSTECSGAYSTISPQEETQAEAKMAMGSSWEALDVSYSDLLPLSNCQVVLGLGGSNESIESLNIVDKTPHYAPVGYPLPNVHALILDENYDPVPRGALGALHILTPALATGYIGDALKTSKRFRPMPSKVHESAASRYLRSCRTAFDLVFFVAFRVVFLVAFALVFLVALACFFNRVLVFLIAFDLLFL